MFGEVLQVGDEVSITIPKESRESGYNPFPDWTKARVAGFVETTTGRTGSWNHSPGVYINYYWVKLVLEDGREHTEFVGRLKMVDQEEYDRRVPIFKAECETAGRPYTKNTFLRNLPETPFWEGDVVLVHSRSQLTVITSKVPNEEPKNYVVVGIDYDHLNDRTLADTQWPAYLISDKLGAGWHTSASEAEMELVERGNVWKYYHNLPLHFADVKEEASFFHMIGQTEEVRNPANNLYSWTKDEALKAIKSGIIHSFSVSGGFFGSGTSISAWKFKDEELGLRIAQATLEGFGVAA